jgi:8-oxo-(d)GTP phosphatase
MPSNKPGSRLIKAAGGVAWRLGPHGEPEILLVHRKKYDDWSLPKGKNEPGEPLPVTAVREVLEEGGARLALGRRLVSVRYNVGGRPKRVHYWAARVLSVDEHAVPNSEVDEVDWLPAGHAIERVSYPHDHGVLADFAAWPAGTVPLILLRHSKALAKSGWKRADADRQLDGSGRSDAKALADLLACFAPHPRLISSPAARCVDTLRPLSQLTGAQVQEEPSLYIHNQSFRTDAADAGTGIAALIREAIASGVPTVVCAHRENISVLQEAALAALAGHPAAVGGGSRGSVSGDREPDGPDPDDGAADGALPGIAELPRDWDDTLPTSGFWVLNVAPPLPAGGGAGTAEPVSAPEPGPAAARTRRWWQLIRDRGARDAPIGNVSAGNVRGGNISGGNIRGGEAALASGAHRNSGADRSSVGDRGGAVDRASVGRPVGVLISADRYDLSEP